MKRETMKWLRELRAGPYTYDARVRVTDILDELKRLRRKSREVTDTDLAVWWDGFKYGREFMVADEQVARRSAKSRIAALKKGGRK